MLNERAIHNPNGIASLRPGLRAPLMGKFHAVRGTLYDPSALAESLARTLLANSQTVGEMRRAVVNSFAHAASIEMAKVLGRLLVEVITEVADEERTILWEACGNNAQVAGAVGLPEAIFTKFGEPPVTTVTASRDDDLPF